MPHAPVPRCLGGRPLAGRRRGIMLIDAVIGLVVVAILAVALSSVLARYARATGHLADAREATRVAEAALIDLQAGTPPRASPPSAGDATVEVRPAAGGRAVAGRRWVEVRVSVRTASTAVTGLVPEGAATATPPGAPAGPDATATEGTR